MSADPDLAFETLELHAPFLRRLARALVRDEHGAEDLAQETWLAALRRPPADGEGARGWLARIARNRARDEAKLASRRAAREREAARPEAQPPESGLEERVELARELLAAVRALREPYRETVWLRFYEGLAPREIARRQGVPLETVRTRLVRAKAELKERLGERQRWLPGMAALAGWREPTAAAAGLALAAVAAAGALLLFAWRLPSPPAELPGAPGRALAEAEAERAGRPQDVPRTSETAAPFAGEELRVPADSATTLDRSAAALVTGTVRWPGREAPDRVTIGVVRLRDGAPRRLPEDFAAGVGEEARFELEVPGGGEVLLVAVGSGCPVLTERLSLAAGERVERHLLGPEEGTALEGRLLDGRGAPIPRALVTAARPKVAAGRLAAGVRVAESGGLAVSRDAAAGAADLQLPPFQLVHDGGAFHLASETARTDEDGRFRFGGLGSGEHVLDVDPDEAHDRPFPTVVLAHRARAHRVVVPDRAAEIVWREQRRVVEVRDERGPLDAVNAIVDRHDELVAGLAEERDLRDWPLRLTLGTSGRLALSFDELDDPALHLARDGHASRLVRLATAAPDAEGRIVVTLPRERASNELRLRLFARGAPLPRVVGARLWPVGGHDASLGTLDREQEVEGDLVRLADVPPGRYRLKLRFPGGAPFLVARETVEVAEGVTELDVELELGAGIELVLDRRFKEPWPRLIAKSPGGATVTLSFGGGTPTPGEPLRLWPALPPGEWTLAGWDGSERRARWEVPLTLVAGEVARVEVALPE